MLVNVIYILPMLLGFEEPESISRYETTKSSEEVRDLLEVSADLSLKVKAGKVDFKGTGSYLKDTSKLGRMIEILTRLKFKTVTVALPPEVSLFLLG
ncbi:uncharacterized protein CEXT_508401, partial [Caerostris extrusa]